MESLMSASRRDEKSTPENLAFDHAYNLANKNVTRATMYAGLSANNSSLVKATKGSRTDDPSRYGIEVGVISAPLTEPTSLFADVLEAAATDPANKQETFLLLKFIHDLDNMHKQFDTSYFADLNLKILWDKFANENGLLKMPEGMTNEQQTTSGLYKDPKSNNLLKSMATIRFENKDKHLLAEQARFELLRNNLTKENVIKFLKAAIAHLDELSYQKPNDPKYKEAIQNLLMNYAELRRLAEPEPLGRWQKYSLPVLAAKDAKPYLPTYEFLKLQGCNPASITKDVNIIRTNLKANAVAKLQKGEFNSETKKSYELLNDMLNACLEILLYSYTFDKDKASMTSSAKLASLMCLAEQLHNISMNKDALANPAQVFNELLYTLSTIKQHVSNAYDKSATGGIFSTSAAEASAKKMNSSFLKKIDPAIAKFSDKQGSKYGQQPAADINKNLQTKFEDLEARRNKGKTYGVKVEAASPQRNRSAAVMKSDPSPAERKVAIDEAAAKPKPLPPTPPLIENGAPRIK